LYLTGKYIRELNSDLVPFEAGVQDKAVSASGERKITKEKK